VRDAILRGHRIGARRTNIAPACSSLVRGRARAWPPARLIRIIRVGEMTAESIGVLRFHESSALFWHGHCDAQERRGSGLAQYRSAGHPNL